MTTRTSTVPMRQLGNGFAASAISFGAMGMSEFYGAPADEENALAVLTRAVELGVTMIDSADVYGRGHNETLIKRFLARHRADHRAGRIRVATKFGIVRSVDDSYRRAVDNSPRYIRQCCEDSLNRLGVEQIDLYYVHRVDPAADIAETVGTLGDLVRAGKIAHIGLCEVSATTLSKAHAVHSITAAQSEYSLWTRDPEAAVLPMCRDLGIGFVAYSPLGRGFLTGAIASTDDMDKGDFRRSNPRFNDENLDANLKLLSVLREIAAEHGATPGQVALAWLLGRETRLVAIPGTRRVSRLMENAAAASLDLSPGAVARLEATFTPDAVRGERYTAEGMKGVGV